MKRCISRLVVVAVLALSARPTVALGEEPSPAAKGAAAIFIPFDFYARHQKALGLTQDQVRGMQSIAESLQQDVQKLEREREMRTRALQEAVGQNPVDVERAMASFRAVLAAENELKALQFRSGLTMRNALAPEQLGQVQSLAAKDGADRVGGARAQLMQRVQQLRSEVNLRAGGKPSPEIVARIEQIERSTREGRFGEAKNQLEAVLRQLRGEPEPGSHANDVSKAPVTPPR
jgi:Spy/CpxP family protein refolding chaperone